MFRVAIVGSRSFDNYDEFKTSIEYLTAINGLELISGGAIGTDQLAERFAHEHGIPIVTFLPDYKKYGRAAPLKRNDLIIDNANAVIAFWDGESRGTGYVVKKCKKLNKTCYVFSVVQL